MSRTDGTHGTTDGSATTGEGSRVFVGYIIQRRADLTDNDAVSGASSPDGLAAVAEGQGKLAGRGGGIHGAGWKG